MIKIACFDLGIAQEDYAIENAKKYGGGALIGRYFKQYDNFHLYAPEIAFENLDEKDRKENCFSLSGDICKLLINGYPIDLIFPEIEKYDIILHGHTHFSFNRSKKLKIPIVHWAGFGGDCGHPNNDYIFLYRKVFNSCFGEKVKYVKIGKDVPKTFIENKKRDGIFQCTQHSRDFNSISIAKECIKYGIKGYFAGPIKDYPLLDYIDNKNTFYLGLLSEKDKLEMTRKAKLYTLNLEWDVAFNQSAIEANAMGTPILASNRGWFKEYIKEGFNGYFYKNNFIECYLNSDTINQENCWKEAKNFSIEEVTNSFYLAFNEVINEWK